MSARPFLANEDAWALRSRQVRQERGACELCGFHGYIDLTFTLWRKPRRILCRLETNHTSGARIRYAHGQEPDHALQVLCSHCHRWVTRRTMDLARECGAYGRSTVTGRTGVLNDLRFAACTEQASNEARLWRLWRIRRWVFVRLFIDQHQPKGAAT